MYRSRTKEEVLLMQNKNFQDHKNIKTLLAYWQECGLIDKEKHNEFYQRFKTITEYKKRKAN